MRPVYAEWMNFLAENLAQLDWYQNLASPISRILVVRSGERKVRNCKKFRGYP